MDKNIDKSIEYFEGIGQLEYPQLKEWFIKFIEHNKIELLSGEKIHLVGNMDLNKYYILKFTLNKFGQVVFVITNTKEFEVITYQVIDINDINRIFIRAVKELKQKIEKLGYYQ